MSWVEASLRSVRSDDADQSANWGQTHNRYGWRLIKDCTMENLARARSVSGNAVGNREALSILPRQLRVVEFLNTAQCCASSSSRGDRDFRHPRAIYARFLRQTLERQYVSVLWKAV
jgi:hypothetical protein